MPALPEKTLWPDRGRLPAEASAKAGPVRSSSHPPDALNLPLEFNAAMRFNPRANFFAEALDLATRSLAVIDQKIAVHG